MKIAAWKMYAEGNNSKTIRIQYNTQLFLTELNKFAEKNNYTVYIGKAIYNYSTTEINNLYKTGNRGNDIFFPKKFSIENFLRIMCLKRRAFSFENEVRIFIVANNNTGNFLTLKNINFNSGIIKGIRVSPYSPFSYDDPRKRYYNVLQNAEFSAIKSIINDEMPNVEVTQSRLYEETKRIIKFKE